MVRGHAGDLMRSGFFKVSHKGVVKIDSFPISTWIQFGRYADASVQRGF